MIAEITHKSRKIKVDLSKPIDISISMGDGAGPRAWYLEPAQIKPVINEHFTGKVSLGGRVNFNNVTFNPHGHITHTECVGHISEEFVSVNQTIKQFFFMSRLLTVEPKIVERTEGWSQVGDRVIDLSSVEHVGSGPEALIIRTSPNDSTKCTREYSNTNPIYVTKEAIDHICSIGIDHLLLDVPSVDRESDGGELLGHHAFWQYPQNPRKHKSITELVYIPDEVLDGEYFLNLQFAPFENDASPSRPVLFSIY
jgi:arylformamidase